MPKTIRLSDIDWDTSSECGSYSKSPSAKSLGLPSEVEIVVNKRWNPTEEAAAYLSDNYGYCVNGCQWEEIKK